MPQNNGSISSTTAHTVSVGIEPSTSTDQSKKTSNELFSANLADKSPNKPRASIYNTSNNESSTEKNADFVNNSIADKPLETNASYSGDVIDGDKVVALQGVTLADLKRKRSQQLNLHNPQRRTSTDLQNGSHSTLPNVVVSSLDPPKHYFKASSDNEIVGRKVAKSGCCNIT